MIVLIATPKIPTHTLNSTSVIAAINEAQSLVKQELDLLSKELNTILNSEIELSRY